MAHTTPLAYEDADERVRSLFDDICARGLSEPPNWAVHLGHAPHLLEGMWGMIRTTFEFRISPLLTQLLLFAVSRANSSYYCAQFHGTMVLQIANFLEYKDLVEICDGTSRGIVPDNYRVAIGVVLRFVDHPCSLPEEEVQRLIDADFDERERLEILSTISLAHMLNAYTTSMGIPIDESYRIPGFAI